MDKHRIQFILCRTRFASNLGSAARVLRNFGFGHLILVDPRCAVGAEARTFAMKGADLLDEALLFPDLEAARSEADLLVATSARTFRGGPDPVSLQEITREILVPHQPRRIGIVFGSEKNGLSREDLALCDWATTIPCRSDYSSLNLAQAVAVLAYECHRQLESDPPPASHPARDPLSDGHWETLVASLEDLIERLPLPEELSRSRIMKRLTQMAARSRLGKQDADLLLGLFKRIR